MYTLQSLVKAILTKEVKIDEVHPDYIDMVEQEIKLIKHVAENKEFLKTYPNGQWDLYKAKEPPKKPENSLNYGEINPRENASINPEAKGIADGKSYLSEENASTISYSPRNITIKKPWSGKATASAKVKEKVTNELNETALDTIKRKQKGSVVKNELSGYPSTDPVMMSEHEPHADDPKHESKEKKKVKKIKSEAQALLDMHKKVK